MEIIKAYMTKNPSYTRNRSIKPIGVLVHSTGAANKNLKRYVDSPDRLGKNQYNNHWNKADADKSVHAFIGYDKSQQVIVAETLPHDRACWGCGGGKNGSYNYDPHAYLQFEICQGSSSDEEYYWKAIKVAEDYCVHLCNLYGWTAAQITSHKEAHAAGYASNHGDPQSWMKNFGDDMNKFRARVAALLNDTETPVESPVKKDEQEPAKGTTTPQAAQNGGETVMIPMSILRKNNKGNEVKTLQRLLTALGYGCGSVDGIFGSKTLIAVKEFQTKKGLTVDGIVGKNTWTALLK